MRIFLHPYRWKLVFTFLLILLEAGISLLFPLFIGFAIDGALHQNYHPVIHLGLLSLIALFIGVGRRIFDSRLYAKIYQKMGSRIVSKIDDGQSSVKSARLSMIRELVEFLENSLPELINSILGLVGVMVIIATLNGFVFYASLVVSAIVFLVYWISSKKTVYFNKSSNDEWEKQVDVLSKNDEKELKIHLKKMMKWNIKLSDLEALNFSISWVFLSLFLVGTIVISVQQGMTEYGALFALIIYVFQYMENVINLPFFYQNWLRLNEIKDRISHF
jgi:ABC-type multidrug transport system fused ATPase/permease subunit